MSAGVPAYKVEDRSILLPFYRRFLVDPLLPLLPASLNPNTITHAGHMLNLAGTVLLVGLWPKSGWPFVAAMVLLQIYMWCDNADGAHARRTNQCSPLGELLDHGLDQLNTVYIAYLTCMALGISPLWWVVIALIIPGAGAVTYWEQSTTGTFRLGLLNQVESLTVLSIVLTGSAFLGNDFWGSTMIFGISLQRGFQIWVAASILFGMLRNAQRVGSAAGFSAVLPILAFFGFGAAIFAAAALGAISTIAGVTLATCMNVYFGMRMLTLRLHSEKPRVEPVLLAGIVVVAALAAFRLISGQEPGSLVSPVLSVIACVVFGFHALADTRKSVQHIERLPAR
jgi:phosphatidylglycerophosphate synthase